MYWCTRQTIRTCAPAKRNLGYGQAGSTTPPLVRKTFPGRRRNARGKTTTFLAPLLHGGPVFGIRIVKEQHLAVLCCARWRGRKTKSPVAFAHRASWLLFGVWTYSPSSLPGVRAVFVSARTKCGRCPPSPDIESLFDQTQYARPHRPAMACGADVDLRVAVFTVHSKAILKMLND